LHRRLSPVTAEKSWIQASAINFFVLPDNSGVKGTVLSEETVPFPEFSNFAVVVFLFPV
jgi:hypothetical protein